VPATLSLSTRRPWLWLPPAFFFGFSVIILAAAPDGGPRLFYAVLAVATGYWLVRAWRVGVDLTDDQLVTRGQLRRHHFAWRRLRGAAVKPMRTMSPFQRLVPYVALTIELEDGRTRQFEEVSAAASKRSRVERVVDEIDARLHR
jgi:hypothetical protein